MATVLVVDDEPDLRELLRLNLSLDGHQVTVASDGEEALELVDRQPPDLILLDVMMPKKDGWEVLTLIKDGRDARAAIPVLMLTARTSELEQVRGAIEGAIAYITKPFTVNVLRRAVLDALGGDPEPVKRRRIQRDALRRLARLERGGPSAEEVGQASPRLTRLESEAPVARRPRPRPADRAPTVNLSETQRRLLLAVGETTSVREAADRLGVSRSYVYASLRRIARKVGGVHSGPELVGLARQGLFAGSE